VRSFFQLHKASGDVSAVAAVVAVRYAAFTPALAVVLLIAWINGKWHAVESGAP